MGVSFFDNLDVEELKEGHEEHTCHEVLIDWFGRDDDGKILAYCLNCEWKEWGHKPYPEFR